MCLICEKQNFDLPLKRAFLNQKIPNELLSEKKLLLKKFENETDLESLTEALSFQFQIKILNQHFERFFVAENSGPAVFVYENQFGYCFHTNPGRVLKLPVGLNVAKGVVHKMKDLFEKLPHELYAIRKYSLQNDHQISVLENRLKCGIEIWSRSLDNKQPNIQKVRTPTFEDNEDRETQLPKIRFHLDKKFDLLLKITNEKMYFRGNLKLLQ